MKLKMEIEATPQEVRELFDPTAVVNTWPNLFEQYANAWTKVLETANDNKK